MIFDVELICGECLKAMSQMPDKSVDMILCDLPYGALNRGNKNAAWDRPLPLDRLWQEYERIIKDHGVIALFAQGMFTAELMASNRKMWRYNLIWDKVLTSGFLNAKKMPLRRHEDICIFYRKLPIYNPQMTIGAPLHGKGTAFKDAVPTNNCYGSVVATDDLRKGSCEKYPTSILCFPKPHPSVAVHPTEKSVELCEWLIRTYTNERDVVLDNCMGSGTTGVACRMTNRRFIGVELNPKYFEIAHNRIYQK